jgi:hypothetical protein
LPSATVAPPNFITVTGSYFSCGDRLLFYDGATYLGADKQVVAVATTTDTFGDANKATCAKGRGVFSAQLPVRSFYVVEAADLGNLYHWGPFSYDELVCSGAVLNIR